MPVFETSGLKATLDELGVYALADGERIVAPVSDAGVNDDRKKERKGEK